MKLPEFSFSRRGIIVGLVQLALVASLGCKLWYDRATLPRVWVRCAGADPDDPLRGRYIRLQLTVPLASNIQAYGPARLRVDGSTLIAEPAESYSAGTWDEVRFVGRSPNDLGPLVMLHPPVAVFLPEHAPDPTRRKIGEELWMEVTVPREGSPRPIRLGVKRPNAAIVPLSAD
jgi:hypothetical protein